jgi:hypothetical protein
MQKAAAISTRVVNFLVRGALLARPLHVFGGNALASLLHFAGDSQEGF